MQRRATTYCQSEVRRDSLGSLVVFFRLAARPADVPRSQWTPDGRSTHYMSSFSTRRLNSETTSASTSTFRSCSSNGCFTVEPSRNGSCSVPVKSQSCTMKGTWAGPSKPWLNSNEPPDRSLSARRELLRILNEFSEDLKGLGFWLVLPRSARYRTMAEVVRHARLLRQGPRRRCNENMRR